MTTPTKTFDCVEMKNRIQAEMLAEYEARRGEFASFEAFIEGRARESAWIQQMRKRFRRTD